MAIINPGKHIQVSVTKLKREER